MIAPRWTREIILIQRALDPLGLTRVSDRIITELLPGITTLTTQARNYSFYAWAIKQSNEYNFKSLRLYNQNLAKLESAYVIGGLIDKDTHFPQDKDTIGNIKATRRIRSSQDFVDVNFSVLNHLGGGYGQYYKYAMFLLGLTVNLPTKDLLTDTGMKLASIYENHIRYTDYYSNYLNSDTIPITALKSYGLVAGYLRLKETDDERATLCNVFFSPNQNRSMIPDSRKNTMLLILDLYRIFTDNGVRLTDEYYRGVLFYKQIWDNHDFIDYTPRSQGVNMILPTWKLYQYHDYFTASLENLLDAFVKETKTHENGILIDEFLQEYDILKNLQTYTGIDTKNMSVAQFLNAILSSVGIGTQWNSDSSKKFDDLVRINNEFSESTLLHGIYNSLDEKDVGRQISNSLLQLLVLIIRYRQNIDSYNSNNLWIHNREIRELSLYHLIYDIKDKLPNIMLMEFYRYIIDLVIKAHNQIAMIKQYTNHNDTYRFMEKGNRYVFKRDYGYYPRSDRFSTISSLFDDMGLITKRNGQLVITDYGRQILEAYQDGR
jgi:hypothetical protein